VDKYSYRFTVASLNVSVIMLVAAGVFLLLHKDNPAPLIPFLVPILTGLGGLLVSPPKQSAPAHDHTRS
jgi:hypothetical protein